MAYCVDSMRLGQEHLLNDCLLTFQRKPVCGLLQVLAQTISYSVTNVMPHIMFKYLTQSQLHLLVTLQL